MTPEDQDTLSRIMDDEAEGGPLILANDVAVRVLLGIVHDCDCAGCQFLRESLSFHNETNKDLH